MTRFNGSGGKSPEIAVFYCREVEIIAAVILVSSRNGSKTNPTGGLAFGAASGSHELTL